MKRKLKYAVIRAKKMLFMMMDQFSDPFYQGVAAQIAFSLFLSIVPIFILMSQLLGLFSLPLSEVSKWINENVTMEGAERSCLYWNILLRGQITYFWRS